MSFSPGRNSELLSSIAIPTFQFLSSPIIDVDLQTSITNLPVFTENAPIALPRLPEIPILHTLDPPENASIKKDFMISPSNVLQTPESAKRTNQ